MFFTLLKNRLGSNIFLFVGHLFNEKELTVILVRLYMFNIKVLCVFWLNFHLGVEAFCKPRNSRFIY